MTVRRFVLAIAVAIVPGLVQAQTFNTLYEYGNAAQSSQTSGAGKARGADFSQSASGKYTITAGGTDFWDVSDHGSAIFDKNAAPVTGDFSAIAKVSIGLQGETMPDEWGRTGIMARTTPSEANSAYFAATQKFNGAPDVTNRRQALLQFRDAKGAGTDRVSDGQQTTLKTGQAGGAVPVWLGLHRFGNQIFQTWAPDVNGAPGAWSVASGRVGSEAHAGPVQLGLFHQNHNVQPKTSTASFSDFKNTNFNNALGDFPLVATRNVGLGAGNKVTGNFGGVEVGGGPKQAVDWKVEVLGAPTVVPGLLARSFLRGNSGSNFDPDALPVRGEGVIPQIAWFGNSDAPAGFQKYYDVFNLPSGNNTPGSNQENYSVDAKGQIFIPEPGTYKFKDGVDDYTYLSIDGEKLIDDNDWTGPAGNDNGGSPIVSKTFAKSGWYDINFKMAEGGGGDSGMLYWDYKNDGFPAKKDTAAKTNALVPAANFRTVARAVLDTLSGKSIQDGILKDANGKTLTVAPGTDVRVTVNGATSVEKLVPEPASMTLALLSAFGLLGVARRRR